jgi:hypothetical protein
MGADMTVSRWLRLEGLAYFLTSILLFIEFQGAWGVYLLFILEPDLSMLGYLANTRTGALTYNLVHNSVLPIALIFAGYFLKSDVPSFAGIILLGHIGADRLLGFGLKYPTAFKDTHLQRV